MEFGPHTKPGPITGPEISQASSSLQRPPVKGLVAASGKAMPAGAIGGVGGAAAAVRAAAAAAWWSRRHWRLLPQAEFLPPSLAGRALELARKTAAAAPAGLRADLACCAGPHLPT